MTRGVQNFWHWIGAKLFFYGYRMQSVRVRRRISCALSVGLLWSDSNAETVDRIARGEHLDISIGFHTEVE
jgi:hypothetical protein